MKANVRKQDAKRFVRSLSETFEEVSKANPGKVYDFSFVVGLAQPLQGKSSSEVKSALAKLDTIIGQFADAEMIVMDVNILDSKSIDQEIMAGTKDKYETSKKLEAPQEAAPQLIAAK